MRYTNKDKSAHYWLVVCSALPLAGLLLLSLAAAVATGDPGRLVDGVFLGLALAAPIYLIGGAILIGIDAHINGEVDTQAPPQSLNTFGAGTYGELFRAVGHSNATPVVDLSSPDYNP